MCFRKFPVVKKFMDKRGEGVPRFCVENYLSHSAKKFRRGTLSCFTNFMHKKGISLNSVEKLLSHSADKIRGRTLLCFERIPVSKFSKQRRGEASRFCRIFFYLTRPKELRLGTILFFRKFLVGKKNFMDKRERGVSRFSVEKLLSHYTKIFHWRTLWCFRKILYRKFSCIGGGGHHSFVENFCLTVPKRKALSRNPSVFQKVSGIEKFYASESYVTIL